MRRREKRGEREILGEFGGSEENKRARAGEKWQSKNIRTPLLCA